MFESHTNIYPKNEVLLKITPTNTLLCFIVTYRYRAAEKENQISLSFISIQKCKLNIFTQIISFQPIPPLLTYTHYGSIHSFFHAWGWRHECLIMGNGNKAEKSIFKNAFVFNELAAPL